MQLVLERGQNWNPPRRRADGAHLLLETTSESKGRTSSALNFKSYDEDVGWLTVAHNLNRPARIHR